jgi:glucose-1-phosphate cytidylyltransferase
MEPFQRLIDRQDLIAVKYDGFWKNMDTFKDKVQLDEIARSGNAPWQVWKR